MPVQGWQSDHPPSKRWHAQLPPLLAPLFAPSLARFPPILTHHPRAAHSSPCRYFDTNYHFEVPELSHDSGERLFTALQLGRQPTCALQVVCGFNGSALPWGRPLVAVVLTRHCHIALPNTSDLSSRTPAECLSSHPPLAPCPCSHPAEPAANWAPLLDRVRRGQAAVGRDRAVPIVVGEWSLACTMLPSIPVQPAALGCFPALRSSCHVATKPLARCRYAIAASTCTTHPTHQCPTSLPPAGANTLLGLARGTFDRAALLARLVPAYVQLLRELTALGVPEVQVSGSRVGGLGRNRAGARPLIGGCSPALVRLHAFLLRYWLVIIWTVISIPG